jgi:hypothetical protein
VADPDARLERPSGLECRELLERLDAMYGGAHAGAMAPGARVDAVDDTRIARCVEHYTREQVRCALALPDLLQANRCLPAE